MVGNSGTEGNPSGDAGRLPQDVIHRLLSSERRRVSLQCLAGHDASITLADLAGEVAERELDTPLGEMEPEEVHRVYVSLYHHHVPKLAATGVVDYDEERDIVTPTGRADRVERVCSAVANGRTG